MNKVLFLVPVNENMVSSARELLDIDARVLDTGFGSVLDIGRIDGRQSKGAVLDFVEDRGGGDE